MKKEKANKIKDFLRKFKEQLEKGNMNIIQRRSEYASVIEMPPSAIEKVLFTLLYKGTGKR